MFMMGFKNNYISVNINMFNPTQRPRRGPLLTHYIEIVSHHIDFSKMSPHLTDKKKKVC